MGGRAERKESLGQPKKELAVIIMGSPSDKDYAEQIKKILNEFGVDVALRVASAHKSPEHALSLTQEYDARKDISVVYIAVAGRSNALSGLVDFATLNPVISAPPYSDKYGGADIYSSLRMPSGIATTVAADAETAALMAVKIFGKNNPELQAKFDAYRRKLQEDILKADTNFRND